MLEKQKEKQFRINAVNSIHTRNRRLLLERKSKPSVLCSESAGKNEHILIWNEASPHRVYLIEKTEHVSQHVGNWHVQELRKVFQVQLLPLQFPGSVSVLLQNLLGVLGLESGTAENRLLRELFMLQKDLKQLQFRVSKEWIPHSNI